MRENITLKSTSSRTLSDSRVLLLSTRRLGWIYTRLAQLLGGTLAPGLDPEFIALEEIGLALGRADLCLLSEYKDCNPVFTNPLRGPPAPDCIQCAVALLALSSAQTRLPLLSTI
jgi:hypothetical protein